jgi:hypothetical protein
MKMKPGSKGVEGEGEGDGVKEGAGRCRHIEDIAI